MSRTVTLTDTEGKAIGEADILEAHAVPGMLHRAFSVYVFRNDRTELLIQQRSVKKMLWPGIWANTCCSHPFENEEPVKAGQRRLEEELSCVCALKEEGTFVYQALDPQNRGAEHEFVTLLVGDKDLQPLANPDEVSDCRWVRVDELLKDMEKHEEKYAPWFHLGLKQLLQIA